MYLIQNATTLEGELYLKFTILKVDETDPMLGLNGYPFVLSHIIDEKSPLIGLRRIPKEYEIVVFLEAVDGMTAKSVQ